MEEEKREEGERRITEEWVTNKMTTEKGEKRGGGGEDKVGYQKKSFDEIHDFYRSVQKIHMTR